MYVQPYSVGHSIVGRVLKRGFQLHPGVSGSFVGCTKLLYYFSVALSECHLSAHNIFLRSAPKGGRCRWICGGLCDDEADGFCAGARTFCIRRSFGYTNL